MLRLCVRAATNPDASLPQLIKLIVGFSLVVLAEGFCAVASKQLISGTIIHGMVAEASLLVSSHVSHLGDDSAKGVDATTFFSGDFPRSLAYSRYLAMLPQGFSSLFCGVAILIAFLGPGALVGLAAMLFFVGASGQLSKEASKIEVPCNAARDRRLQQLRQVVEGMKAVKYYAWEDEFAQMLQRSRLDEVGHVRRMRSYMTGGISLGKCFPVIAAMLTLVTVAATHGGNIDAADAFATVAVFQTLRVGMITLPLSAMLLSMVSTVFDRVEAFMRQPALVAPPAIGDAGVAVRVHPNFRVDRSATFLRAAPDAGKAAPDDDKAVGKKVPLKEERKDEVPSETSSTDFTLSFTEILDVRCGTVCAVVGPVAAGKSTLLEALLGELRSAGDAEVERDAGYSPQTPFVCTGTIIDNVCLGRPFDEEMFRNACDMADLHRDFSKLALGRDTLVGERGVTLSGGQQHRVSIARAVYAEPRLVILDGSLAAVDAAVGRRIFEAIVAYVRAKPLERSAVVVLSQLHLLRDCDDIVCLDAGRVASRGRYDALLRADGAFSEFCRQYQNDDAEDEEEDDAATQNPILEDFSAPLALTKRLVSATGEDGGLISAESIAKGGVSARVFLDWGRSCGIGLLFLAAGGYVLSTLLLALNDLCLSAWANAKANGAFYMGSYAALSGLYLISVAAATQVLVQATTRGSTNLHQQCVDSLLAAPMSFFDATPSGRIISRFAADIEVLDLQFGNTVDAELTMATMFIMIIVALCIYVPVLIPMYFACSVLLVRHISQINGVNRNVRRLANNAVSPAVTNVAEADRGRVVARVLGCADFFVARQRSAMDTFLSAFFMANAVQNMAWAVAQVYCTVVAVSTVAVILLTNLVRADLQPIALTYALIVPYFAGMMCDLWLQATTSAASLERLFEYLPGRGLEEEAPRHVEPQDAQLVAQEWPSRGAVEFKQVDLRYRPGLSRSLRKCSFVLKGGERCGVVGRTGAGKSTIMMALFRLVEPCGGTVLIDGVDVSKMGLGLLRDRVAMIPQEAVILEGTGRSNVDPFGKYSDAECEAAIVKVGLSKSLLSQKLGPADALSIGERQLLAIARVVVRGARVVCMDEPTAHVDAATDAVVQRVVSLEFKSATFITIAHRLHTIIDYDQTLVLDQGNVVEFGRPADLVDAGGPFAQILDALGPAAVAKLRDIAKSADAARKADRN